jgi:hypothetical protein
MKENNKYPRENKYDDIDQDEAELNQVNEEASYYGDSSDRDILDDLNPEQLRDLEESIEESERGETIPWEEFLKNFDEWRAEYKRQRGLI